jgi:hypothetical protein
MCRRVCGLRMDDRTTFEPLPTAQQVQPPAFPEAVGNFSLFIDDVEGSANAVLEGRGNRSASADVFPLRALLTIGPGVVLFSSSVRVTEPTRHTSSVLSFISSGSRLHPGPHPPLTPNARTGCAAASTVKRETVNPSISSSMRRAWASSARGSGRRPSDAEPGEAPHRRWWVRPA